MSNLLFDAYFTSAAMRAVFCDHGRLQGMLDFEAALARAEAAVGVIPQTAVAPIAAACRAERYDAAELARAVVSAGNSAIPLVKALGRQIAAQDPEAERHVHRGATSQDAMDSGLVLQIRQALDLLDADLAHLAEALPRDAALVRGALPGVIDSQGNAAIAGGGLWPEPDAFESGVALRSFFWARSAAGGLQYSEDYNAASATPYQNESWYTAARSSAAGRCVWSDGYLDTVTGVAMTTCSVPYRLAGQFAGVATVDLRLDGLATFLREHGGITGGYAFVVDKAGNLLFSLMRRQPMACLPWLGWSRVSRRSRPYRQRCRRHAVVSRPAC